MAPSISFTGTLNMAKGLTASGLAAALALASLAGASGHSVAGSLAGSANEVASGAEAPVFKAWTGGLNPRPSGSIADGTGTNIRAGQAGTQIGTPQPPSDAEIAERAKVLLKHQHANDEALEQYERIEHHVDRTGSGTMKLLLKDGGRPVDAADYRKQLVAWEELLELMLKPEDSRAKSAYAKWQKRKDDREELLDATREGFRTTWGGQETCNGRVCDVYDMQPN